jgi:hypothetical protein
MDLCERRCEILIVFPHKDFAHPMRTVRSRGAIFTHFSMPEIRKKYKQTGSINQYFVFDAPQRWDVADSCRMGGLLTEARAGKARTRIWDGPLVPECYSDRKTGSSVRVSHVEKNCT